MSPELKARVQIILGVALIVAALRLGYVLYERHQESAESAKPQPALLDPDYYVVPKKLRPYNLKEAHKLTEQPVWVKEGYRYTYYPYNLATHRADFSHEAGTLLPIERLEIKDVVTNPTPDAPGQRQVLAIFEKDGKQYAVPVGTGKGDDYTIYSDEMFFIQDPHELYKWPANVWDAVEKHEVKVGMDEFQVAFALGMGIPEGSGDTAVKTVDYPNGGSPMAVTFSNRKVVSIRSGK